jgi:hypothetical protein
MPILNDFDFPDIRAVIDVSLDDIVLPDAVIRMDAYWFAGEADVVRQDALWATRTGDAERHIRLAAIYYVASRLALALPTIVSESTVDGARYQRQPVDWAALAGALRARGDAALAAVLESGSPTANRPRLFTVARGYRGR